MKSDSAKQQKWQSMIYISNTRLPTEKARGLQIIKSCEAFQVSGLNVTLAVPRDRNPIKGNSFFYYGVKTAFQIKKITNLSTISWVLPDRWAFYARSLVFAVFSAVIFFPKRYQTIFYSRDYAVLVALALLGFKFVAEIHDYRSKTPKRWIAYSLNQAYKIIVNSQGTKSALLAHYKIPERKMAVVPNGVDLDFFKIGMTNKAAREKLGISSAVHVIGYVGSLEMLGQEKGIFELVEAIRIVSKNKNDVLFYIVGGPDEAMGKYKKITGLATNIVFTGRVNYRQIPLYLKAMDAVVIPLPADTLLARTSSPIKIFEYLAAGKVIIASDVPATRNYLNHDNALFYDSGHPKGLADTINMVLTNHALATKLSEQALKDAQQYSWLARAKKIEAFLFMP